MRLILLTVAVMAAASPAAAFEDYGYQPGMSETELTARFPAEQLVQIRGLRSDRQAGFLAQGQGQAFVFCDGTLATFQQDIAGGLQAFVRQVQAETSSSGPGLYSAQATDTHAGSWVMLTMDWAAEGGRRKSAQLSQIGEQAPTFAWVYKAPNLCGL